MRTSPTPMAELVLLPEAFILGQKIPCHLPSRSFLVPLAIQLPSCGFDTSINVKDGIEYVVDLGHPGLLSLNERYRCELFPRETSLQIVECGIDKREHLVLEAVRTRSIFFLSLPLCEYWTRIADTRDP